VDGIDSSTWAALGLTLTTVGLALSVLVWRRRGAAAGLRAVAWSLLPAAAGLTRTLKLASEVVGSVVDWAAGLVFNPLVWLGIVLAGISVVLFVVSGAMRSRGVGSTRTSRPATEGSESEPALPAKRSSRKAEPAVKDDDMDDIEAILRKHGIQ
jgi:hypothetical protein